MANCRHSFVTIREDENYKYQECVMCGATNLVSKPKVRGKR